MVQPVVWVPAPVGAVAPKRGVPAPPPVRVVPATPPHVEEDDDMDYEDGEEQVDPDPPEGEGLDAILAIELLGASRFAGMASPLGFTGNPIG